MRQIQLIATFLIITGVCHAQPPVRDDFSRSIVQVIVTFQEYNNQLPWQKKQTGTRSGYGVIVGPSEIITTEGLVRNNTLVELRLAGSGEKITAKVVLSDEQANLAMLTLNEKSDNPGFVPVSLLDNVFKNGDVTMLQFDETAKTQLGKAQIVQISMRPLPSAPHPALTFTILTDLNINGEGAVALRDGKLAGIAMSYDRGTRTGNIIPSSTLKHFISDIHQHPYKGFASAGFTWSPLIEPAKRNFYKVNNGNNGILVLNCMPGSGASAALKPKDVILEWDGHLIDNLGFYEDPDYGRMALPYLITGRRAPGDLVPVKIIRDGREMHINVKLSRKVDSDSLVPENITMEREEYIVEGGFIIRELSGAYLNSYGQNWQKNIDPRIVNIYLTRKYHPDKPGDKVVILAGVLPDPINVGYQHFRDDIITAINGKAIRNLADVFRILEQEGSITRLSLQSMEVDLVLEANELTDANDNLARLYRIPRMRFQRR